MNFAPTYVTAVILYGHDACARLGDLLGHWDAILHENDWNQFLFFLVDDNPPLPDLSAKARSMLGGSILKVNPADIGRPGYTKSIVSKLRDRIQNNGVCLQTVVSFRTPAACELPDLAEFVGRIQGDFKAGAAHSIFYLLLGGQNGQQDFQRAFAQNLSERGDEFPYVYLLGDYAQDGSTIQDAILWRAIHSEMLVNSSVRHQLLKSRLYSVGYSALNANNQELVAIRQDAARRYLLAKAEQPLMLQAQAAWEILTQRQTPFRGLESAELFSALRLWLEQTVVQQSVFPTAEEKKNNRLLADVYRRDKSPREIQESIRRFYSVNCGHSERMEQEKDAFFQRHRREILAQLSGLMEAGAYPLKLLDAVEQELGVLCAQTQHFSLPVWDAKRMFASHTDYTDRQCEALEDALERYYRAEQLRLYAREVYAVLDDIRTFAGNAKALPGVLGKLFDQSQAMKKLPDKYPRYFEQVEKVIGSKPVSPARSVPGTVYFQRNGSPAPDVWKQSVGAAEKSIGEHLPAECSGSFCKIIQWEYSSADGLLRFFYDYLAKSKRMLYEVYDTPGGVQSLYITDAELAIHQWAKANEKDILTARNDNVERIDLFMLEKDLAWYLDNSAYFRVNDTAGAQPSGPDPLFGSFGSVIDTEEPQATAPEQLKPEAAPAADQHNLQIRLAQSRYVLTWDWEAGSDQAVVVITPPQGTCRSITCSLHDFNAPVYGLPNGIDITNDLPYGKVRVEIHSRKGIYASAELTGQKRGVYYRFERGSKGLSLRLKGHPDDIGKLLLREPRKGPSGQYILYPLQVNDDTDEHTITGISLRNPADCAFQPYPGDTFPTVYAERY